MIGYSDAESGHPPWEARFIRYVQGRLQREGTFEATIGELQAAADLPYGFYEDYDLQAAFSSTAGVVLRGFVRRFSRIGRPNSTALRRVSAFERRTLRAVSVNCCSTSG